VISKEITNRLEEGVALMGLGADADQVTRLITYLEMLQKWNKTFNLTSITDPDRMITHHLLDSLSIRPYLNGHSFIDVGTGAGLPGIPLAIMDPLNNMCLLDSNNKKCRFLTQVKIELRLENITVSHQRVEEHRPATYQSVLSRAYSSLREVALQMQHLLADQGTLMAMRGRLESRELSELPKTIKVLDVHKLDIPFLSDDRNLVIMGREKQRIQ
jgi:16S rRNA (guanine527-N7)-methyltransferase